MFVLSGIYSIGSCEQATKLFAIQKFQLKSYELRLYLSHRKYKF